MHEFYNSYSVLDKATFKSTIRLYYDDIHKSFGRWRELKPQYR